MARFYSCVSQFLHGRERRCADGHGKERKGKAQKGKAWQGWVGRGMVRQGKARILNEWVRLFR